MRDNTTPNSATKLRSPHTKGRVERRGGVHEIDRFARINFGSLNTMNMLHIRAWGNEADALFDDGFIRANSCIG